jgi:endonuclease YncB( thermonuclease family)
MFGLTFGGKVTRVLDGDTLEVEVRRTVRIRLLGCWAPETRTRDMEEKQRGLAARAYLNDACFGRDAVVTVPMEPDARFGEAMSMGRVLGYVAVDGSDLSEHMVQGGHATKEKSSGD